MTMASLANPQERRTQVFFDAWWRATGGMTLEEMGAYAALSATYAKTGEPIPAAGAHYVVHASTRKWRRIKKVLLETYQVIELTENGSIIVVALSGRLYRTGYLYKKAPISAKLRWAVFQRDGYQCKYCGTKEDLTADHIIPEIDGGMTVLSNLQTLCRPCNSSKGGVSFAASDINYAGIGDDDNGNF